MCKLSTSSRKTLYREINSFFFYCLKQTMASPTFNLLPCYQILQTLPLFIFSSKYHKLTTLEALQDIPKASNYSNTQQKYLFSGNCFQRL